MYFLFSKHVFRILVFYLIFALGMLENGTIINQERDDYKILIIITVYPYTLYVMSIVCLLYQLMIYA